MNEELHFLQAVGGAGAPEWVKPVPSAGQEVC